MCISTEEIIIMKDGKLFLSSVLSFSHLRIQIFYLINHLCCINKRCVEMLSGKKKKVLSEAFHSGASSARRRHTLSGFCVHPCVCYAAGEVTQLQKMETVNKLVLKFIQIQF